MLTSTPKFPLEFFLTAVLTKSIYTFSTASFVFFFLRELCEGKLEGGLLYWGPWRKCKGRLWRRACLSIGSPLGNLEEGSYTGDFER
jgi:hypothetical protein